jgi:hypothetical protein
LDINRDDLFFHAGIAVGSRGSGSRYFWPSAAAALLLACTGLAAVLIWQVNSIGELRTALAVAEHLETQSIARGDSGAKPQTDTERSGSDHFLVDERLRQWQRLASAAPFPPGRLTAMGWEQLPGELGNGMQERQADRSDAPESSPHRPATYLELMRLQREG